MDGSLEMRYSEKKLNGQKIKRWWSDGRIQAEEIAETWSVIREFLIIVETNKTIKQSNQWGTLV